RHEENSGGRQRGEPHCQANARPHHHSILLQNACNKLDTAYLGGVKRNFASSSVGFACGSNVTVLRLVVPAGAPPEESSKILRTSAVSASIHTTTLRTLTS